MRRWRRPAPGVEMVEVLEPDPAVIAEGRWYAAARGTGDLVGLGAVAFDAIEREDGPALEIKDCAVRACLPTDPPAKPKGCCATPRIAHASAKCSDRCSFDPPDGEGESQTGYVPEGVGIGGGDYLEIVYCLSCGRLAGDFPVNLEEGCDD